LSRGRNRPQNRTEGPPHLAPGDRFAEHDLGLTTQGTLRRDADALAAIRFDHGALDELQAIKTVEDRERLFS